MIQVTCALIIDDGKVLVTQNGMNSDHPLQWEFPGGKMHVGETEAQCICREIKEELELEICIVEALRAVVHDYGIKKIRLIPFICVVKSGMLKLNNHIEKDWVELLKLSRINFSEADRRLLELDYNQRTLEKYSRKQMY